MVHFICMELSFTTHHFFLSIQDKQTMYIIFSVANTVKRAFLIWMSVVLFGNSVTLLSGLGTLIVIFGVLLYNKAQDYDSQIQRIKKAQIQAAKQDVRNI